MPKIVFWKKHYWVATTTDCFEPIFGFIGQFCFEKHRSASWSRIGMFSELSGRSVLYNKKKDFCHLMYPLCLGVSFAAQEAPKVPTTPVSKSLQTRGPPPSKRHVSFPWKKVVVRNTSWFNPNWHEGGHFPLVFPPIILFLIRFCQLIFYRKFFKHFWRWKLTSIWLIWHPEWQAHWDL